MRKSISKCSSEKSRKLKMLIVERVKTILQVEQCNSGGENRKGGFLSFLIMRIWLVCMLEIYIF